MINNGCFKLDMGQRTVMFFPHYQVGDYHDPLLISHSLNGPNDKAILVNSMAKTYEVYGPGSYQYPLAYCLQEVFEAGGPAIWAFSSSAQNLFDSIPKVIEESVYPFCKELADLFRELNLAAMKYVPLPEPPHEPNIEYRSYTDLYKGAQESQRFDHYKDQTQFIAYHDKGLRSHVGDPAGPSGPMGHVKPKQTKDFRNIGKSSNAKKRW
jgi:hypothetical protein